MTLPEFGLNYESCTKAEIWKFCKQRHAPVGKAHRKISKRKCIKALRNLDHKAVFLFFGICAELRLMVYPYLLTHDHGQDFREDRKPASEAFPQILRASKLCYKEARDILYDRSSLTLTVLEYDVDQCGPVHVGGDIDIVVGEQDLNGDRESDDLFKQIWKFENLRSVKIPIMDFSHPHDEWGCSGLSFLLESIVSCFRTSRALEVLTVKFVCECFDGTEEIEYATEYDDGIATAEDVQGFEAAVRASSLLRELPATTALELVDFRKATRKALLGLRKDIGC